MHPTKKYRNGKSEWSNQTTSSLSMGYNISTSTVQLLKAFSILVNNGRYIRPSLISQSDQSEQLFSVESCLRIKEALSYVCTQYGTGAVAFNNQFTISAKSGTTHLIENGQYTDKKHLSSFVGFFPSNDPKYICAIHIQEPLAVKTSTGKHLQHGGVSAGSAFKLFSQDLMNVTQWSKEEIKNQSKACQKMSKKTKELDQLMISFK